MSAQTWPYPSRRWVPNISTQAVEDVKTEQTEEALATVLQSAERFVTIFELLPRFETLEDDLQSCLILVAIEAGLIYEDLKHMETVEIIDAIIARRES